MLLGEDLEREISLTQKRGLIQCIVETDNGQYNVSLQDVIHNTENDPPVNQKSL
jgi:uncharacterized protein YlxP (DUF503 family)